MANKNTSIPRSAPAPALPFAVSETVLAGMLGLTDRRVRQLVGEGIAIKSGPASYDLAATLRAFTRDRAAKSERSIPTAAAARAFARALANARDEQTANPARDPLDVIEGEFLPMLLHAE